MSPSKRLGFSLNPLWLHYAAFAAILFGVFAGLVRIILFDPMDPLHCNALLNGGAWLDDNHRNWQPEGCMMHIYQPSDASACLSSQRVVFIGDSITRKLFFQLGNVLDPKLPTGPPEDDQKHTDHTLRSSGGTQLDFFWDPFLNTSHVHDLIVPSTRGRESGPLRKPALLVLGSGLWYLRYADSSGGLPAWEANTEATLNQISRTRSQSADEVVILPIEEVVPSKLSQERANTMRPSDIDAMNSDLFHRINPPPVDPPSFFSSSPPSVPVALPLVFNHMLDSSQTEDGLHFSDAVVKMQANILLNLRCNDVLPKTFPMDKTCCRKYPWPSSLQLIILGVAISWGPATWFLSRQRISNGPLVREEQIPALITSAAVALIFAADRTGFWLKEQKQFSPWIFAFLSFTALGVGLGTVKRGDKDLGFLNRDQTDEWKGWMQIAILIYHYLGASKISGIYNPIRVLVAAYLFMTGYGHTMFYIKKADFGFLRVAQIMVRLNLLTLLLAYTMNTDYISYYFAPLVSMWYLIVYGTMAVGSQFNENVYFLASKILVSMGVITWFMHEPWLLESLFEVLARLCGIRWSAREWAFRVNLDLWIVYFGVFTALVVIKIREHRLTDHPHWPLAVRLAIVFSALLMIWFFAFELFQESKFTYNPWHPYISFLPISAFAILRNASPILRSASSRAFAFVGKCSLETFIIQYHFWLAGDTKGVLLVLPGTKWRSINFVLTTIMFVYVSHRVAQSTAVITKWICGDAPPKGLPTTGIQTYTAASGRHSDGGGRGEESIPLNLPERHVRKDNDGNPLPPEPDTPIRPTRRWLDRLAEGDPSSSSPPSFRVWYGGTEWKPGVGTKLAAGLGLMWIVNVLWPYP